MAEETTTTTPVETATPPAVEPGAVTELPRSATPDTPAVETPTEAAPETWKHILPPKHRDKSWTNFESFERFLDHVDGVERVRGRSVVLPESTDDPDWEQKAQAIYRRLGAPESADAYQFEIPEGAPIDTTALDVFRESALNAGLNQKQVDVIYKAQLEAAHRKNEALQVERARAQQEMRETWSTPVYEHKMGQAEAVLQKFFPQHAELLKQTGILAIRDIVDGFSNVYSILEPEGIMPQGSPAGYTRDGVRAELNEIKASEAYRDPAHRDFRQTRARAEELEKLRAALNGSR